MVTTADLRSLVTTNYPNNTSQEIDAADLRGGFNLVADLIDFLVGGNARVYPSRQAAVDDGPIPVDVAGGRIITLENDSLVVRGPGQTGNDPLFGSYPNWGILFRTPNFADLAQKADLTSGGKFFSSRAAAVAAGQTALPAALGRVIVEEGDYIVWRGPGQTGDQLFSSYPNWGIVRRVPTESVVNGLIANLRDEVRNGRVYYEGATDTPSGRDIPSWADFVTTAHYASGTTRDWRPRGAPEDGQETDFIKLDANGRWWTRMQDAAVGNAIRDGGIITTTNIGGTGDAITVDISPAFIEAGITTIGGASEVEYIPSETNESPNPTFTIGEQTFGIRNADGGTWPAKAFVVGRSYKLRRRGGALRVSSGDATSVELANTFTTAGGATGPSGLSNIPLHANYTIITNNGAGTYSFWRAIGAPEPPVEQDNAKMSADGRWWLRVGSEEAVELRTGRNQHLGGADSPSGRNVSDSTTLVWTVNNSNLSLRAWRVIGAPSDGLETDVLKKDANDRWWRLVWQDSDGKFHGDESFRSPDAMDEVWYKILTARDGSAWLGSYIDGSWAAPTAFGAFRWPGDDLVILETQSGEPILAVAPDGTLIFKERS